MIKHTYSFSAWRDIALASQPKLVTCHKCDGEGEVTEECCECGNDTEKTCSLCDGTGNLVFADLSRQSREDWAAHTLNVSLYKTELLGTLKHLAEFTNRSELDVLSEYGIYLYHSIQFDYDEAHGAIVLHKYWSALPDQVDFSLDTLNTYDPEHQEALAA
jgi:hypothetical protein